MASWRVFNDVFLVAVSVVGEARPNTDCARGRIGNLRYCGSPMAEEVSRVQCWVVMLDVDDGRWWESEWVNQAVVST